MEYRFCNCESILYNFVEISLDVTSQIGIRWKVHTLVCEMADNGQLTLIIKWKLYCFSQKQSLEKLKDISVYIRAIVSC